MKIYIASPFFNEIQLGNVKFIEMEFRNLEIDFFSPRSVGSIKSMSPEDQRRASVRIYKSNIENIVACDTILAVVDGSDTGTIYELGYAVAYRDSLLNSGDDGRRIITMSFKGKGLNVMLRECVDHHIHGIDEFAQCFELLAKGDLPERKLDQGDIE